MKSKLLLISAGTALFLSCSVNKNRFTETDILKQLDAPFEAFHKEHTYNDFVLPDHSSRSINYTFLLDLEHGYCLTAGSRIHLYADSTRWAIVFEKGGYQNRGDDAEIELDYFGNCFTPSVEKYGGYTYFSNAHNIKLVSAVEYERIRNRAGTEQETFEYISPNAAEVDVRGKKIKIEHDPAKYAKAGINLNTAGNANELVGYGDLIRYINETDPATIAATEKEIRENIPANLPKLMTINSFHFESVYDKKNLPSTLEMYRLIARVLAHRDTTLWKPTLKANNHWTNWNSGNL